MVVKPTLALALTLCASTWVTATLTLVEKGFQVHRGSPCTIRWSGETAPVDIYLLRANAASGTGTLIAKSVQEGSFTWTPPSSQPLEAYYFTLTDKNKLEDSKIWALQPAIVPVTIITSTTSKSTTTLPSSSSIVLELPTEIDVGESGILVGPTGIATTKIPSDGSSTIETSNSATISTTSSSTNSKITKTDTSINTHTINSSSLSASADSTPTSISQPTQLPSSEGGLSNGAKIGIGVVASLAGLLLLNGVGLIMYRFGKRSMMARPEVASSKRESGWHKPELSGDCYSIQSRDLHEMEGEYGNYEVATNTGYHEAPTDNGYSELGTGALGRKSRVMSTDYSLKKEQLG